MTNPITTLHIGRDVLRDAPLHIDPTASTSTLGHLVAQAMRAEMSAPIDLATIGHNGQMTSIVHPPAQAQADALLDRIIADGDWWRPGINPIALGEMIDTDGIQAPILTVPLFGPGGEARRMAGPYCADWAVQIILPPTLPTDPSPLVLWRWLGIGASPEWRQGSVPMLAANMDAERASILQQQRLIAR